eukprot:2726245-Rhodomonas_salina.1
MRGSGWTASARGGGSRPLPTARATRASTPRTKCTATCAADLCCLYDSRVGCGCRGVLLWGVCAAKRVGEGVRRGGQEREGEGGVERLGWLVQREGKEERERKKPGREEARERGRKCLIVSTQPDSHMKVGREMANMGWLHTFRLGPHPAPVLTGGRKVEGERGREGERERNEGREGKREREREIGRKSKREEEGERAAER